MPSPDSGSNVRSAIIRWTSFEDCDGDGSPDRLEIAVSPDLDSDADGVLDACAGAAPEDIDIDGRVNGLDLALLLSAWGVVTPATPRADINRDGTIDGLDLGRLLSAWTG